MFRHNPHCAILMLSADLPMVRPSVNIERSRQLKRNLKAIGASFQNVEEHTEGDNWSYQAVPLIGSQPTMQTQALMSYAFDGYRQDYVYWLSPETIYGRFLFLIDCVTGRRMIEDYELAKRTYGEFLGALRPLDEPAQARYARDHYFILTSGNHWITLATD